MLQALLHKKLKASFENRTFKLSEDTLTSSVIGLLRYLPSEILASILKNACGICSSFPLEIGEVIDIRFWEHWDGTNTSNSRLVEPDVLIVTEHYNIIIEAKKSDERGQYSEQWQKEIKAYRNSYSDDRRELILIALGGNVSLKEQVLRIGKDSITIFRKPVNTQPIRVPRAREVCCPYLAQARWCRSSRRCLSLFLPVR